MSAEGRGQAANHEYSAPAGGDKQMRDAVLSAGHGQLGSGSNVVRPLRFSGISSAQPCPICLHPITGDAFLDPCFHTFCYHCILQWAEMVFTHPSMEGETCLECPLCKTRSSCIIHSVVLDTFQRHYLFGAPPSKAHPFLLSEAHFQRLYVYKNNLHCAIVETLNQNVQRKRKWLHISGNKNVQEWLRRELQALMQEEDVELVMQHVLGVLEQLERQQKLNSHGPILWTHALVDEVKSFLFENGEFFCKELQNFLLSGLNVKAYDLLVEETLRAHTLRERRGGIGTNRVEDIKNNVHGSTRHIHYFTVYSWTSMIAASVDSDQVQEALNMYQLMQDDI